MIDSCLLSAWSHPWAGTGLNACDTVRSYKPLEIASITLLEEVERIWDHMTGEILGSGNPDVDGCFQPFLDIPEFASPHVLMTG